MKRMTPQLEGFLKSAGILDNIGNVFKNVFNGNNQVSTLYGLSERVRNTLHNTSQQIGNTYQHNNPAVTQASRNYINRALSSIGAAQRRNAMHTEALNQNMQNAKRLMQENAATQSGYRAKLNTQMQQQQQKMQQVAGKR